MPDLSGESSSELTVTGGWGGRETGSLGAHSCPPWGSDQVMPARKKRLAEAFAEARMYT